jgi:Cu(I)/Ag(I) efflux system membrane fusion protein
MERSAPPAAVVVGDRSQAALGIRSAVATAGGAASTEHRAPATVSWDPLDVVRVSAQPGGQIRELALPRVGEPVERGRVIARLYAPEVRAAFEELRVATTLGEPWISAARSRLIASGVDPADVDAALDAGNTPPTYAVRAPAGGVVLQRLALEGDWLQPGGAVAVVGDTDDLVVDMVVTGVAPAEGTKVTLRDTATGDSWYATVSSLLPTASAAGAQVRLLPDETIPVGRPLVAEWTEAVPEAGVWVPQTALVDTGTRKVVFVEQAAGRYEPRSVRTGAYADQQVQILEGVTPGERIVVSGTFLLDSETQIGAAGHSGHGG